MTNGYNTPIGVPIGLPSILSLGLPPLINPYPTLNLDFINNPQFDSRITFTRGSQATLFDSTGTLVYAKQNVLLQSQDFSTTWSVASQNASITTNTAVAPDGTTTADTITDDATSGIHRVSQTVTTSSTAQLVFSVFAKYSTMQWIGLSAATSTGAWAGAKFDIQNGVLGSTSQQGTGWAANSSSITSIGNGWYRCVLVFTPGATGSTTFLVNCATDGTTFTVSQRGSEIYSGTGSSAFIWGAQLNTTPMEGGVTSSLTTYYPTTTAAYYAPRFDYNPSTLAPRGLLIEEQRTNLLTYSEDFTNAAWTAAELTVSGNSAVAPDGTTTADKLVESAATALHVLYRNPSYTSGLTYTATVFAKAAERTQVHVQVGGISAFGALTWAVFDLSTQTVVNDSNSPTTSIANIGNGWFRLSVTKTATATGSPQLQIGPAVGGTATYAGNGTSGVFVWGAQLEAGAFPTSYIPTTTTALTRNADVASMTGTNFSSWYNASEGTFYAQYSIQATAGVDRRILVVEGSGGQNVNGIIMFVSNSAQKAASFNNFVSSSNIGRIDSVAAFSANTTYKGAFAITSSDRALSVNGATAVTSTSAFSIPSMTNLAIGQDGVGNTNINGHIQRISFYSQRLPNATLQALTA